MTKLTELTVDYLSSYENYVKLRNAASILNELIYEVGLETVKNIATVDMIKNVSTLLTKSFTNPVEFIDEMGSWEFRGLKNVTDYDGEDFNVFEEALAIYRSTSVLYIVRYTPGEEVVSYKQNLLQYQNDVELIEPTVNETESETTHPWSDLATLLTRKEQSVENVADLPYEDKSLLRAEAARMFAIFDTFYVRASDIVECNVQSTVQTQCFKQLADMFSDDHYAIPDEQLTYERMDTYNGFCQQGVKDTLAVLNLVPYEQMETNFSNITISRKQVIQGMVEALNRFPDTHVSDLWSIFIAQELALYFQLPDGEALENIVRDWQEFLREKVNDNEFLDELDYNDDDFYHQEWKQGRDEYIHNTHDSDDSDDCDDCDDCDDYYDDY